MKSIKLTKEHKAKLLEMCNKLFSKEGKFFTVLDGDIYYSKNGKFPGLSIHWFEFCMTYLVYKLSYEFSQIPNIKGEAIHLKLWELNKGDYFIMHPVDYLYEEFKKLK